MDAEIGIVGAGIIGTACANLLAADGTSVVLIDSVGIGDECSWGNAGYLAPNLVFPIAGLKDFRHIPRYLLDRNGPLRFRWQHLPALIPWLLRFARNSTPDRVRSITRALHSLNKDSIEAFGNLFPEATTLHIERRGELRLYESELAEKRDVHRRAVWDQFGIRHRRMPGNEVREIEPNLAHSVHSAILFPDVAHCIDPPAYVKAIGRSFRDCGGDFIRDTVTRIESRDSASQFSLQLTDRKLRVKKVVIAAGIHSRELARQLGHQVPLDAERGYHILHPGQSKLVTRPLTSVERGFVVTPMTKGLQLSGTVEFGGTKLPPDYERATILDYHAKVLLPSLSSVGVNPWMGMRPSLPDSLPIIGESNRIPNAFFAFGHQHLGLTQGATTALAIESLIKRSPMPFSLFPFRIDRF